MGFGKNALQNKKFRAKVDLMGTAFNGDSDFFTSEKNISFRSSLS